MFRPTLHLRGSMLEIMSGVFRRPQRWKSTPWPLWSSLGLSGLPAVRRAGISCTVIREYEGEDEVAQPSQSQTGARMSMDSALHIRRESGCNLELLGVWISEVDVSSVDRLGCCVSV